MLPTDRRAGRLPLKRAVRYLRERSVTYRRLLAVAIIGIIALGALLAIQAGDRPDPIILGTGQAGVNEAIADSQPLAADEADAEDEPIPLESVPGTPVPGGAASYYGSAFEGRPTASGERFNPEGYTAAHRSLPLGSRVRVTNLRNGRDVIVRINDRGPFHGNRVIDLSQAAARELGFLRQGTARVQIELLTTRS
jgi:rare lipoprotein A